MEQEKSIVLYGAKTVIYEDVQDSIDIPIDIDDIIAIRDDSYIPYTAITGKVPYEITTKEGKLLLYATPNGRFVDSEGNEVTVSDKAKLVTKKNAKLTTITADGPFLLGYSTRDITSSFSINAIIISSDEMDIAVNVTINNDTNMDIALREMYAYTGVYSQVQQKMRPMPMMAMARSVDNNNNQEIYIDNDTYFEPSLDRLPAFSQVQTPASLLVAKYRKYYEYVTDRDVRVGYEITPSDGKRDVAIPAGKILFYDNNNFLTGEGHIDETRYGATTSVEYGISSMVKCKYNVVMIEENTVDKRIETKYKLTVEYDNLSVEPLYFITRHRVGEKTVILDSDSSAVVENDYIVNKIELEPGKSVLQVTYKTTSN